MNNRLYRSATDRPISGVAGGLATWLGLDPSLVRVAWVVLSVVSGGLFVLVYIVMMIVVPVAPPDWQPRPAFGPGAGPAPDGTAPGTQWPDDWAQRVGQQAGRAGQQAGVVTGLFLIALGGWFLVDEYIHIDWQVAWPVVVILMGIALLAGSIRRR